MANNPLDPKYPLGLLSMLGAAPKRYSLLDYVAPPTPKPEVSPMAQAIADLLRDKPKPLLPLSPYPYTSGLGDIFATPAPANPPSNALAGFFSSPVRPSSLLPTVKRKAFFSFHFDDIMRVNVVRNAWKIDHPDNAQMRSFQDSSLWERRELEGDDAVKRLIREGVEYTSAVCVLIGTDTWARWWVRYEIARAIVDGKGLLGVHLNSIRHHQTKTPHTRGHNPLEYVAICKEQADIWTPVRYYLCEAIAVPNGIGGWKWEWRRYNDYTLSVTLPPWLADPSAGCVTQLSQHASVHDYIADDGHRNIGSWIDAAAQRAGR